MAEDNILDLLGNIFKVIPGYKLTLDFPVNAYKNCKSSSYNRDRVSGQTMIIINKGKGQWIAIQWISHLSMYLTRKLKFIKYEEITDIRFEWRHRKEAEEFVRSYLQNA